MIGDGRTALVDEVATQTSPKVRGKPFAMFVLLISVWVTGRALFWESPFAADSFMAQAEAILAEKTVEDGGTPLAAVQEETQALASGASIGIGAFATPFEYFEPVERNSPAVAKGSPRPALASPFSTHDAAGHYLLWRAAFTSDTRLASNGPASNRLGSKRGGLGDRFAKLGASPAPPWQAAQGSQSPTKADRWLLDVWAFYRQGSNAAPISQGRVPVYGASQAGANLQFRAAPNSGYDPRLYARAYRALIDRPESEVAVGISARPIGKVPVRVSAEVRATDNRFGSDIRPAAFAVTELPAVDLPLGAKGEIYAGAGYVGGDADTAFVDGQATITKEVATLDASGRAPVRLSLGAGAWGGAQRDANRIDVGPTIRLDLSVGDVPARFSVDWRERVGGDASPTSGLAATLSTRF